MSDYFENVLKEGIEPKTASNWISSIMLGNLNKLEKEITEFKAINRSSTASKSKQEQRLEFYNSLLI